MALGYSHESFWAQTPYTLELTFDAHAERLMREHNDRAWLAWTVAALIKARRLPPLSQLQKRIIPRGAWDDKTEALKAWVIKNGGKVIMAPSPTEH